MIPRISKHFYIAATLLALAALACALPEGAVRTPVSPTVQPPMSQTSPTQAVLAHPTHTARPPSQSTPVRATAEHRITTHRIYGIAGFFDRKTSKDFVPRGVNYAILIPILDHYEDRLLATGVFDPSRIRKDFNAISSAGYNTVRIILDGCTSGDGCIGIPDGEGLNPVYLDNLVSLMVLARDADLFLIIASRDLPELGGYAFLSDQEADQWIANGRNAGYLTRAGIQAAQKYWTDLLTGLIARQAPLEVVLGWEIQSEQYFQADQAPFNLQSGKVTPANGRSYDVSKPAGRNDLAADGLRYYIRQVRQVILTYDPTALVTMGFFAPDEPNSWREGDERMVLSTAMLAESDLDFFDFHASPDSGLTIAELSENFGLTGHLTRPVVLGEVGAATWTYPQVDDGVIAIQDWVAASCAFGFSGWLYNGYYPEPAGLPGATWGFVDVKNTILNALSPQNQPDACLTTVLPGRNLALGKQVTVSAALPDEVPSMAVDGDPNTQWSAGAFPEQWIEIDLGGTYSVGEIRLTVGQWPDGEVLHQVWVGTSQDTMRQVYEVNGDEFDYDVLSYSPPAPMENIRYVRVVTTLSPSWVSWREIEVLAPFPTTPTPTSEATSTAAP